VSELAESLCEELRARDVGLRGFDSVVEEIDELVGRFDVWQEGVLVDDTVMVQDLLLGVALEEVMVVEVVVIDIWVEVGF